MSLNLLWGTLLFKVSTWDPSSMSIHIKSVNNLKLVSGSFKLGFFFAIHNWFSSFMILERPLIEFHVSHLLVAAMWLESFNKVPPRGGEQRMHFLTTLLNQGLCSPIFEFLLSSYLNNSIQPNFKQRGKEWERCKTSHQWEWTEWLRRWDKGRCEFHHNQCGPHWCPYLIATSSPINNVVKDWATTDTSYLNGLKGRRNNYGAFVYHHELVWSIMTLPRKVTWTAQHYSNPI